MQHDTNYIQNIQRLNTMYSELQIQVHVKQTEKETQYIYRQ